MPKQNKQIESPFGVLAFLQWDHPWNCFKYSSRQDLEKAARLLNEAGIAMVRFDFLWEDIEPEEGSFNFEKYDLIVEVLKQHNIKILGILNYSAPWAAACPNWNCRPRENKLFVNYAVRVINRYKDKVKHWEIWNEPDSSTYWSQQDGLKSY
ncbi:MAG: family 1 glycosylhydrolase, partial [Candidatus Omnitrophota bacterium]|nr:family 1 glycosylhydrolase [Candidatus Omnitrophota bacterium]